MERVRLLDGANESVPRMLEAIRGARRSVHLETYIFERDGVGDRFIEELRAAARRGVHVSAIIDGIGSPEARFIAGELERAGADVRVHGLLSKAAFVLARKFRRSGSRWRPHWTGTPDLHANGGKP